MKCFRFARAAREDLTKIYENNNKINWLAWSKILKPKNEGGLSLCDVRSYNLALLAKHAWRLCKKKKRFFIIF